MENLITSNTLNEWNILELPDKKVILSLRKKVSFTQINYSYELPFKILNPVILVSSEDITNYFIFTATIDSKVAIRRWPNTIGDGWTYVNVIVIGNKIN